MKPSIGRIVIYQHPGSADGKFPPQKSPAIIQAVLDEEGTCRLFVFGPKGQHMDECKQGNGPCEWSWPERI